MIPHQESQSEICCHFGQTTFIRLEYLAPDTICITMYVIIDLKAYFISFTA